MIAASCDRDPILQLCAENGVGPPTPPSAEREESIGRTFGLLVSEDDFSASGAIDYEPPTVRGEETNLEQFAQDLRKVAGAISEASNERDRARAESGSSDS